MIYGNIKLSKFLKVRNKRKLLVEQLDEKLAPFQQAKLVLVPDRGWIHTIRKTLNMTMEQLGNKLGISRQGVYKIEESEANGTITHNTLNKVAAALNMKLVYALVPNEGTIDQLIQKKAEELAQKIVLRTNQNMRLEDQGIKSEKLETSIQDLAYEIKRELRKSLWD